MNISNNSPDKKESISAAFIYFVAGSVAATGINLITGALAETQRTLDSIITTCIGITILYFAYLMTKIASIYDAYEKALSKVLDANLSVHEMKAAQGELYVRRKTSTVAYRWPLMVCALILAVVLIYREIAIVIY